MQLTNTLVSSFAKLATTENKTESDSVVYGEAKNQNGSIFIKIDGSDVWSPALTQANISASNEIKNGDRVSAIVKNHSIIIIGNIDDPSASSMTVDNISSEVDDIKNDIEDEKNDREEAIKDMQTKIDSINGLYFSQDENNILWLTNKPIIEESALQWKITGSSISVSTDYGRTFNFALDVSGTAILEKIYLSGGLDANYLNVGGDSEGVIKVYDSNNNIIGVWDSSGLKINRSDGSYILLNPTDGLVGFDSSGNKTYWASQDIFHMQNAQVENEIQLAGKIKIIPVDGDTNKGVGFVSIN